MPWTTKPDTYEMRTLEYSHDAVISFRSPVMDKERIIIRGFSISNLNERDKTYIRPIETYATKHVPNTPLVVAMCTGH